MIRVKESTEERILEVAPVKVKGEIVLYDMFINGRWVGSRRTIKQCCEVFGLNHYNHYYDWNVPID